jgi:hypothetical protein
MKAVVHGIRQNHPTDPSVTSYQIPSSSYEIKSECFVHAFVLPTAGICIGPQSHWHDFLGFSMVQTNLELGASCIATRR